MRAATAALPEPCSATTSMGTSFCDSSRIMASTVRMPALTLSIQIRALPFCGAPAVARISVRSMSILVRFTLRIWRPKKSNRERFARGLTQSRAPSLPNQPKYLHDIRTIYALFSMSCYQYLLSSTYSYVTTLRTNGKFIAHLVGNLLALLPTWLGDKVLTLGLSQILLRVQRDRSAPTGSFCAASSEELPRSFGKDRGGCYSGGGGGDGDGFGRRRQRIELGYRSRVAGDAGIGVGVSASGAAVVKVDVDAGNGIAVLVGDEHGEALGQLRSRRCGLIIAHGDGDVGSGSGNGMLGEGVRRLQSDRARCNGNGSNSRGQLQNSLSKAVRVRECGRRIGNGSLGCDEFNGNAGDVILDSFLKLGSEWAWQ